MWWQKDVEQPDAGAAMAGEAAAAPRRLTGEKWPEEDDLHYCSRRIAEEEALAEAAGSWEAGLVHDQMAMLYRAQLASLHRFHPEGEPACAKLGPMSAVGRR